MKEKIIKLIESRIKSEFKKHPDLDWAKIAAIKIYRSLDNEVCPNCESI
jgi:hypothetical protein